MARARRPTSGMLGRAQRLRAVQRAQSKITQLAADRDSTSATQWSATTVRPDGESRTQRRLSKENFHTDKEGLLRRLSFYSTGEIHKNDFAFGVVANYR